MSYRKPQQSASHGDLEETASRLTYSALAISVAIHWGTLGIKQLSAHRNANIMCCGTIDFMMIMEHVNIALYRIKCSGMK